LAAACPDMETEAIPCNNLGSPSWLFRPDYCRVAGSMLQQLVNSEIPVLKLAVLWVTQFGYDVPVTFNPNDQLSHRRPSKSAAE